MSLPPASRRLALLSALLLAACATQREAPAPAESFESLRFDYLTPIRLNVATIDIEQRFVPGGGDLSALDPAPPLAAIRQMAQDRLQALGTSGRAVLAINDASIIRRGDAYEGSLAIELDIYASDGTRAGFAEARVSARRSITTAETVQRSLYELTKQLMDALNVEFEFQVRGSLKDWLLAAPTSTPAPVQQESLPVPATAPAPAAR